MMLYVWIIFASFLWGSNVLVMKYMLEYTSPLFLALLKVLLSLSAIGAMIKYKHIHFKHYSFKLTLLVSLLSITINFILTFAGLNLISGSTNAIINSLAPLTTIILARIFFKQRITKNQILAVMIACFAFLLSIEFKITNLSLGHLLMVSGIIVYCFGNLLMQHHLDHNDNLPFTFDYLFYAFIQLVILNLIIPGNNQLNQISILLWVLFIAFSGIGFAIIQIIYFQALHQIGSIKASFLLGLNPIFTYLGSLFLSEKFDWYRFLAMGLMVLAMIVANKQNKINKLK